MKKKIAFVLNNFQIADGVAQALLEICNHLDKSKYDITIIPLYKIEKNMKERLANKDVKVKKVFGFYFRGFSRLLKLIPIKLFYKVLLGKKYDIEVGFQFGLPTEIVGNSTNKKAKHIIWIHGYDYELKHKSIYEKADKVACVSKENAKRLYDDLKGNVNVQYCYNIVDEKKVREKAERERSGVKTHPYFVTVGRLSEEKGYLRLLQVCKNLVESNYLFHLDIVGGGAEFETLQKYIDNNKLGDFVDLLGRQENPHKYTINADAYVCSSFSEGYSVACVEAVLLGVPVISTQVSGANEIIEDSNSGIVVENSNEGIEKGMKMVLENEQLTKEWKEKIKSNVYKFEKKYRCEQLDEFFSKI